MKINYVFIIYISFTAVLFQDAVILGAANEPMPLECTSPAPTSLSPQAFPFCTLERTVSHIVIKFNRKMLKFKILLTDPAHFFSFWFSRIW